MKSFAELTKTQEIVKAIIDAWFLREKKPKKNMNFG
jgi:hypothetical protein